MSVAGTYIVQQPRIVQMFMGAGAQLLDDGWTAVAAWCLCVSTSTDEPDFRLGETFPLNIGQPTAAHVAAALREGLEAGFQPALAEVLRRLRR